MRNIIKKISILSALALCSSNALSDQLPQTLYRCNWRAFQDFAPEGGTLGSVSGQGPAKSTIEEAMSAADAACNQYLSNANLPVSYTCAPSGPVCLPYLE